MELPVANDQWFKDGLCFECTGCGNCCTGGPGYIWISEQEIARLAQFLKISAAEVRRRYCRKLGGRVSLKEKAPNARGEYDCIFLQEMPPQPGDKPGQGRRMCTIYPVRPLQCRTWPFWEGNLASRRAWNAAADRCPGINAGRKFSAQEIVARRDARDWPTD